MKFVFTKHAVRDKLPELEKFGWKITKARVKRIVRRPRWRGTSKHGQETAMDLADSKHILRVVFNREDDIIKIITFHVARRESMKVHYDKEEDILTIILTRKKAKLDDTYETDYGLVGVTEKGEPIMVDIFDASKFFAEESRVLPQDIKQKFFAVSS